MARLERVPIAGDGHAVAARVRGLAADEVIALVDREDEERVRLVDPVGGQAAEEGTKCIVVGLELGDVTRRARAVGDVDVAGGAVVVMGVAYVGERYGDAGLPHPGGGGERGR